MPLIELDPPGILPRGQYTFWLLTCSCGSVKNGHTYLEFCSSRPMPKGVRTQKSLWWAPPASSSSTLVSGRSASLWAKAAPDEPAPTTT